LHLVLLPTKTHSRRLLLISFALSPFDHKETHSRTLLFSSEHLKHGPRVDY
jgi:hypothetical protein